MISTETIPITGHTGLVALLGSPVAHSLSPLMHNEAFRLLGLDVVYLCFDVAEGQLETVVRGLREIHIKGFNVTMPHKGHILPLLDEVSPAARLVGAVNTVVQKDGKLYGHNTDGIGFVRSLLDQGTDVAGKDVTILGAGGAATALLAQMALDGARSIHVCLRTTSRHAAAMQSLAARVQEETSCKISLVPFEDMGAPIRSSHLLVNATNVGMGEGSLDCPLTDLSLLRSDLFVADVIYHPQKTRLLAEAENRGARTMNGLGMLLYQGAEAFRLWTGREMPIEAVKKKVFGA